MICSSKAAVLAGSLLFASAGVAAQLSTCFTGDDVACHKVLGLNLTRVCTNGQVAQQCQDIVGASTTFKRVRGADVGENGRVSYTTNGCQDGEAIVNLGSCSGESGSQTCSYTGFNTFTCPSLCPDGDPCSGAVSGGTQ